jgi:signal transduction histidine kinase
MKASLRTRIALGLGAYSLLLSIALIGIAYSVHESLEWMLWRAQLDGEMAAFLQQRAQQSSLLLPRSGKLRTYVVGPGDVGREGVPTEILALAPGTHDDIEVEGIEAAVMVRAVGDQRIYMAIDVSTLETEEDSIARWLIALTSLGTGGLVLVVWWLSGRLVHPVSELAIAVDGLQPGAMESQRLRVDARASSEVQSITNAMNRLLGRVDESIRREREFVNTVSHELRTPLAVIGGAAQLAEQQPGLADAVSKPLRRISQSVHEVEQLIHLLLVLAKSPERLHESDEEFNLETLLPEIVGDHQYLVSGKALRLELATVTAARLRAPPAIVQVAISNLLRNAIEHSDRGVIQVSSAPAGVVRIQDSGLGMSPEEISRVYATLARSGERRAGQGIGLALIARICEHLSWRLEVQSTHDQGTLVVLDLRSSMVHG